MNVTDREAIVIVGKALRDHWEHNLKQEKIFDPTKGSSELEQAWQKILWLLLIYENSIQRRIKMSDDERYIVAVYENFLSQGMSEEEAEKATKEHMERRP